MKLAVCFIVMALLGLWVRQTKLIDIAHQLEENDKKLATAVMFLRDHR